LRVESVKEGRNGCLKRKEKKEYMHIGKKKFVRCSRERGIDFYVKSRVKQWKRRMVINFQGTERKRGTESEKRRMEGAQKRRKSECGTALENWKGGDVANNL